MTEISKLSAFAAGGTNKIDKNRVDMSERAKLAKNGIDFKQDNKLTADEMRLLKKEFGMDEAQVKEWIKVEGGMEFLNAMLHAQGSTKDEIKQAREQIAKDFLMKDVVKFGGVDPGLKAQLKEFGVSAKEIDDQIADNIMNKDYPIKTITPHPATGNTTVENVRLHFPPDKDGNVTNTRIDLFDANKNYDTLDPNAVDSNPDYKGSLLLDQTTGLYVKYNRGEGEENEYFKLNGDQGLVQVSKAEYETLKEAATNTNNLPAEGIQDSTGETDVIDGVAKPEETQPTEDNNASEVPVDDNAAAAEAEAAAKAEKAEATKKTFSTIKKVTVDSTGSKQKLWLQDVRDTGVVVLKKKGFAENGLPNEVAIELPGAYGQKSADGVQQKRYQHWVLLDAEKGIYGDRAGIRKFQASVDENGNVKFTQVEIDDAKVKAFLDKNAEIAAAKAKEVALNKDATKFKEELNKDDAKTIIAKLSDRNNAWETYLQAGTENGYMTGTQGLLEKLVDDAETTGVKTYNDLKPAIDGLLARVPEDIVNSPEYKAVKSIVDKLATNPDAELSTGWFKTAFGMADPIRALDNALMNLAKTHLAGGVQGTNHANNSYLVGNGAAGKVTITPEDPSSVWKTDANFNIGGKNYNFYRDDLTYDKCYDFQDIVGHETAGRKPLITNDVTGNNRQGEIVFHADRLEAGKTFYFQSSGGAKLKVTVKDGVAYINSSDGKTQVPVNDVLNGRAKMPS